MQEIDNDGDNKRERGGRDTNVTRFITKLKVGFTVNVSAAYICYLTFTVALLHFSPAIVMYLLRNTVFHLKIGAMPPL